MQFRSRLVGTRNWVYIPLFREIFETCIDCGVEQLWKLGAAVTRRIIFMMKTCESSTLKHEGPDWLGTESLWKSIVFHTVPSNRDAIRWSFCINSNRLGDRLLRVTIELNSIVFVKKCFNGAGMSHSSASPKSRFTVCTNVLKVMTSQKVGGAFSFSCRKTE